MPWQGPEWDERVIVLLMQFMDSLREADSVREALEKVLPGHAVGARLDRLARALSVSPERLGAEWEGLNDAERRATMRRVLRDWKLKRGYVD